MIILLIKIDGMDSKHQDFSERLNYMAWLLSCLPFASLGFGAMLLCKIKQSDQVLIQI